MKQNRTGRKFQKRVSLAVAFAAILVVYYVPSKWTAFAVPVVWISAYYFGWYEANDD